MGRRLHLALAVALVVATGGRVAGAEPTGDVTRSFNQRLVTKVRAGTYLRGDGGLPVAVAPDLSAPDEARMLAEAGRHFARSGQLDAIGEVMAQARDQAGVERVVEVARRERQRFFAAMRELQRRRQAIWLVEAD